VQQTWGKIEKSTEFWFEKSFFVGLNNKLLKAIFYEFGLKVLNVFSTFRIESIDTILQRVCIL